MNAKKEKIELSWKSIIYILNDTLQELLNDKDFELAYKYAELIVRLLERHEKEEIRWGL